MAKRKKRRQTPIRHRKARPDASIKSIVGKFETMFGLPVGSVVLVKPSGDKLRRDSTVGKLRELWETK